MLKKVRNLRALKPGQWARTRIPDYECWQKPGDWSEVEVGREVDACICPIYVPMPESQNGFHWRYRAAIRRLGRKQAMHVLPSGWHISPWDLGMVDGCSRPFWDVQEYRDSLDGKGIWLYEPASTDPELCPGADCSIYLCEICGEYRMPWSDQDGNLVCPYCELTGLVIDPEQADRLEKVRDFARQMGLSEQLERQLCRMDSGTFFGQKSQCWLTGDFAPNSFTFCHYLLPEPQGEKRKFGMNGGLIYSGPGSPGDGSFPALSVNLHDGVGWFCHT